MKRIALWTLFELVLLSSGCAQNHAHLQWTDATVTGLAMSLEDPDAFEELRFEKNGIVSVTGGQKNGPIASPLFYWRVEKGQLQFGYGHNWQEFTLVSRDTSQVVVTDQAGKTLRFKIIR